PRRLLALADDLAQALAAFLARRLVGVAVAERQRDGCGQRIDEQRGDLFGRAALAPLALGEQRARGALELRRPALVDRAERAQQLDTLREVGPDRVEHAHDREVLPERRAPLLDVVAAADHVDQRHARPPGPAKDLHLRLVLPAIRPAAVDDVEDTCAFHDRPEQLALVAKARIAGVTVEELLHDLGPRAGAAVVRIEPREG